jgi:hypothetical protein
MEEEKDKMWKVKCKHCGAEYEMKIGNVQGLRKGYCLYCQRVGGLKIIEGFYHEGETK